MDHINVIEAAINAPGGKEQQPGSPTTIEKCIEQSVAHAEAGAPIIHAHAFDPEADRQDCSRVNSEFSNLSVSICKI